MPIELTMLGLSALLGLVHILAAAQVRTRQYGVAWNMGARDETLPPPQPIVGRLLRAQANFFETFPLFAVMVLGAGVAGRFNWQSALGVQLYFWARVAYLPVYAAGIPRIRTLIFLVSIIGFGFVASAFLVA